MKRFVVLSFLFIVPSLAQAGATPGADARMQQQVQGHESIKIDRQKSIESNRAKRESRSESRSAEHSRSRSRRFSAESDGNVSQSAEVSINAIPLIAQELANSPLTGPCAHMISSASTYTPVFDPMSGRFYIDPYSGVGSGASRGFTYSSGDPGRVPAVVKDQQADIVLSCYRWLGQLEQMSAQALGQSGASIFDPNETFSASRMGGAENEVVIDSSYSFEPPIQMAKQAVQMAVMKAVAQYFRDHPRLAQEQSIPMSAADGGFMGKRCIFPTMKGFMDGQRTIQCGPMVIDTASKTATMDGEPWYSAKGAYGVTAAFRFVSGHAWKRAVADSRDYQHRNSEQAQSQVSTERGYSASARKSLGTSQDESGSSSQSVGTSAGLNGGQ